MGHVGFLSSVCVMRILIESHIQASYRGQHYTLKVIFPKKYFPDLTAETILYKEEVKVKSDLCRRIVIPTCGGGC